MLKQQRVLFSIACTVLFSLCAIVLPSPAVSQPVILEIVSRSTPADIERIFSRTDLESFPPYQVVTDTPWTEGDTQFEGVLVRDLLPDLAGTQGTVIATALNDYSVEIPLDDFFRYDVILAMRRDGEILTIRDRGPLWIIYPWAETPALRNELYYSRSIWQLKKIEVKENQ